MLEDKIKKIIRQQELERRLGDKRAEQFWEMIKAAGGDMLKADYDQDADGIVDKAENVDDGAGNASTAVEVKDAVDKKHVQAHAASHSSGQADVVNHDNLAGFVVAEHKSLPNTIAEVLSNHTKAIHDSLAIDHGSLGGRGDDDHSQYYNSTRHTKAVHDALGINAATLGTHAAAYFAVHGGAEHNNFSDYVANRHRLITVSTNAPSGGANGDVWLEY